MNSEPFPLKDTIESAILSATGIGKELPEDRSVLLRLIGVTGQATNVCSQLQQSAVNHARRMDIPWSDIGTTLGISRQAAQQRFASEDSVTDPDNIRVLKNANAFNEMGMLKLEGEAGYHLVGFGPLTLKLMPSRKTWQHERVTSLNIDKTRALMEKKGWTYIGSWFPFHYFKRAVV